jgi:GNAT superfamily N-acetyltransferase
VIRDARPADFDVILAMLRELAEYEELTDEVTLDVEELRGHLFGPEPVVHALLAFDDHDNAAAAPAADEAAGFALWYPTYSSFFGRPGIWLEDLYVRPVARRGGHGRALLDALRTRTDGRLEWSVLDWNEPAIAFYRSLGAEPVGGWTTYRWSPGKR